MPQPFSVQCPNCDARLKIQNPKAVGKKVRCPNCQNPFTVKPPRTRPPEDDFDFDDDYEEEYEKGDDYDDFDAPPRRSARRPAASPSHKSAGRSPVGKKKSRKKSSSNKAPLIAGGAIVAFLLLVGFGFLIYNLAGGGANTEDFAWLPPDSQMVASIDVDEIWNSNVFQRSLNNPDTEIKSQMDEMKKQLQEAGFEEGESIDAIDHVTLGMEGPGKEPIGVIRKKTPWNVEALTKKENLKEQTHEGKTYYRMGRDALYFPEPKVMLIGREDLLKETITRGPTSKLADKFSFLPKGHVVIGFMPDNTDQFKNGIPKPGGMLAGKEYLNDIAEAIPNVKGGALAIRFGSGVEMEVLAKCSDSTSAGKLSGGISAGLEDVKKMIEGFKVMMPPEAQEMADVGITVTNTISASHSGDNVTLTGEVSSTVIDKLEKFAKDNKGGRGKPPMVPNFDLGKLLGGFGGGGGDRARDMNNLKQIGIAMHNYHETFGSLPVKADQQQSQLSWRVHILPYIDQAALYHQFRMNEPWNSPHNMRLVNQMPEVYRRPGSNAAPGKTCYVGISGPGGLFENGGGTQFRDVRDGLSNTIMVTEVMDHAAVTWTQPVDFVYDRNNPARNLGGWNGGFHALLGDGSVRFISLNINPQTLLNLFQRNDGNPTAF